MFKIICDLEKISEGKLVALRYNNCQPCDFSDYQMFEKYTNSLSRIEKAVQVAAALNGIALDISKPEYTQLANKMYFINDLRDYKYITLFDESTAIRNVQDFFGLPWIYSTIIRYTDTNSVYDPLNLFSYLFKDDSLNEHQFITLWEKFYLFSIPAEMMTDKLKGTIRKEDANSKYYAIDDYFLMHLFSNQQNTKCTNFNSIVSNNEEIVATASDLIYEQYKADLPRLFGLKFLDLLSKIRSCISINSKKTIIFTDESKTYILDLAVEQRGADGNVNTLFHTCSQLNGVLVPVSYMINQALENCAASKKAESVIGTKKLLSNDLYGLTCKTLNETVAALSYIDDFFNFNAKEVMENFMDHETDSHELYIY